MVSEGHVWHFSRSSRRNAFGFGLPGRDFSGFTFADCYFMVAIKGN